jgi:hypothetical protein
MKSFKIATGTLIAVIALFLAIAPVATTADLQSQMTALLRQIVDLQQRLIATLQAEAGRLTDNSTHSQLWPLQQAFSATSTTVPLPTSAPNDKIIGQFVGSLRNGPNDSWSLLMSFGKDVASFSLQFTNNSICIIGPDEGLCTTLQSNFNQGDSNLGGDNVSVDGDKQGNIIIVRKLILNDNFVMNGRLIADASESGQKMWSLVYQPPVGDSAVQNPNRPLITIPIKFDGKSFCGNVTKINCDLYALYQDDWVFVSGIKYKGVLIVRTLTLPDKAPSVLPLPR